MQTMTLEEFRNTLIAQGVSGHEDFAFVCPMCGFIQSGRDLIQAGAGRDFDDIEKYLAFSCVGRFTGAGSPRKVHDGKPCNWTLGGLFRVHKLEVITPDGEKHPRFEPATPEQAQEHAKQFGGHHGTAKMERILNQGQQSSQHDHKAVERK